MFCSKCGANVADGAAFCSACGQPVVAFPSRKLRPESRDFGSASRARLRSSRPVRMASSLQCARP